jgi:hypothetical protein
MRGRGGAVVTIALLRWVVACGGEGRAIDIPTEMQCHSLGNQHECCILAACAWVSIVSSGFIPDGGPGDMVHHGDSSGDGGEEFCTSVARVTMLSGVHELCATDRTEYGCPEGWMGPDCELCAPNWHCWHGTEARADHILSTVRSGAVAQEAGQELQRRRDVMRGLQHTCSSVELGWWSYELCHLQGVTQYHRGKDGGTIDRVILGKILTLPDEAQAGGQQAGPFVQLVHTFDDGTPCDGGGRPRSGMVIYVCEPSAQSQQMELSILAVDEPSVCVYEVSVHLPALCSQIAAAPPADTPEPRPAAPTQHQHSVAAGGEELEQDTERDGSAAFAGGQQVRSGV